MASTIELSAGDYRLVLEPGRGGSIARFDWRGEPLMRPTCGPAILDAACFPLVPFSNRIAHGRFLAHGREIRLLPNLPDSDHPHPLHGFGWLAEWAVLAASLSTATIAHLWPGGEWPWPYRAWQRFDLTADGLTITLSLTNLGDSAMPAGLGFHPYFPRDPDTRYLGLHRGEWQTDDECLPLAFDRRDDAIDWWHDRPVSSRTVDTVYSGRCGPLLVSWPSRGLGLMIGPDEALGTTVVYAPKDADFFCVEPVSHIADAVNRGSEDTGLWWLAPGECRAVSLHLAVTTSIAT